MVFQGDFVNATAHLEQSRETYEALKGADHFKVGIVYNDIANIKYFLGELNGAIDYLSQSLRIQKLHLGIIHFLLLLLFLNF